MPRIMWKSLHHCLPSNLTKPSSSASPPSAAASSDDPNPPSILFINNFNLLYDHSSKHLMDVLPSPSTSSDESESYVFASPPPDLTALYASRRFFFSSPGRSNSITDSRDDSYESLLTGGTAVKEYVQSPDPYNDFRRSMQEMLEAGDSLNGGDTRRYEFLHELLLSYLSLNAEDTHKFIIRAFADTLVSLLSDGHRTC